MTVPGEPPSKLSGPLRLVIADDHPMTRNGIALILDLEPDIDVIGQAGDGEQALALYRSLRPDVILMDIQMPVMGGVAATKAIIAEFPSARVVLFTTYDGDEDIYRGLGAGAKAYLLKDAEPEEVRHALRLVHAGQRYVPTIVGRKLVERMSSTPLTERELEVLRLIACGHPNKEIAHRLGVTEGTVKSQVNAVTTKLGVQNRTEAALTALRRGLIRPT